MLMDRNLWALHKNTVCSRVYIKQILSKINKLNQNPHSRGPKKTTKWQNGGILTFRICNPENFLTRNLCVRSVSIEVNVPVFISLVHLRFEASTTFFIVTKCIACQSILNGMQTLVISGHQITEIGQIMVELSF